MDEKIAVAFRLNGGLGTYLIETNFIQHFFDAVSSDVNITVFAGNSDLQNEGIFRGQYFISQYFVRSMYNTEKYDLAIDINWFPKVVRANMKKIKQKSEKLQEIVNSWISFRDNPRTKYFMELSSVFDPSIYTYAIARGETRLTVCDIDGLLGIERQYRLKIQCFKTDNEVLGKFGLQKGRYITMQQGVNIQCRTEASPRQWPKEHYRELCALLKKSHPEMDLVQLGESENNSPIEGVDCCLLGKTDFEDLKVILKNAVLHIDGDCGMVHLRKVLRGGVSIVLYGQTSEKVLCYDDDIALTSDVCKHWCGKLFDAWKRRCYISDRPLCMEAIMPQRVANTVDTFLSDNYSPASGDKSVLQRLLDEKNIKLDQEWVLNWLGKRLIHAYWLETVKIGDLVACKLTSHGYIRVPINQMPAYEYLEGNRQSYIDYMALNDQYNVGHEHSLVRFESLLRSFQAGMDNSFYPVVDGLNRILDGAHRACWMAYQYGLDTEITVLKIYGDWKI